MKTLILAVLVVVMAAVAAPCQEGIGMAFAKVEGKTAVAVGTKQHQALTSMITLVNLLKKQRALKKIDSIQYNEKVAVLIEHAKAMGVTITN